MAIEIIAKNIEYKLQMRVNPLDKWLVNLLQNFDYSFLLAPNENLYVPKIILRQGDEKLPTPLYTERVTNR